MHEKRDTRSDFSELKKIHVEAKNFLGQNERKKKEGGGGVGGGLCGSTWTEKTEKTEKKSI